MDRTDNIIDMINSISGKYSAYEVFTDWIKCSSLAISNSITVFKNETWKKREESYKDVMKRYNHQEQEKMILMLAYLAETLETNIKDVLGEIYMRAGMGSKAAGQFFTPFHLSKLCSDISLPTISDDGKIYLNEPSCGGGGMIIATASSLKDKGINYQDVLEVTAQDLDWKGVYMCYLQLSLLGISAVCIQGNTLANHTVDKYTDEQILYTPKKAGLFVL